ncbi:hypothetical protein CDD81_6328 [Ophiocordyceps australis]|uniref:F-box domain-containing protein n=1 Tax=Ophiocordyceps australis TaxID=1399860 RepID=A0A2C5Y630_9HYPO|nr:hypothetical protein CDD81_6328 [Ophiocordyceps australis]
MTLAALIWEMSIQDDKPIISLPCGFRGVAKTRMSDWCLDNVPLKARCPLDNRKRVNQSAARLPVGQLDTLPAELISKVLLQLDVVSLTNLRRVNRRAMDMVDSIPQYAKMLNHCPDIIRAATSMQANAYDCCTLFNTLSTTDCSTCGNFGAYLYLIDCRRVCSLCAVTRAEFLPIPWKVARAICAPKTANARRALTNQQLRRRVPSILSLPGRYFVDVQEDKAVMSKNRLRLFDEKSLSRVVPMYSHNALRRFYSECWSSGLRNVALISAPHLFDNGVQADWGLCCLGCYQVNPRAHIAAFADLKYLAKDAQAHVEKLGPIVWNAKYYVWVHKSRQDVDLFFDIRVGLFVF